MKRITYDFDAPPWSGEQPPEVGCVLVTVRGHAWLVETCRQVRSQRHPSRWALGVSKVEGEIPESARMLSLRWKPRGKAKPTRRQRESQAIHRENMARAWVP